GKTKSVVLTVYSSAGGWGTARLLSTNAAAWPQVSMVGCNRGLVAWQQADVNGVRQFVNQFVAGGGWTGEYPISPEHPLRSYIIDSVIASDDDNKAMLGWSQYFYGLSGGYKLKIRELDWQNGWGAHEELGNTTSFFDLSINQSGEAVFVRDNYSTDLITSRQYQPGSGWGQESKLTENWGYRSYHYPQIAKSENGDAIAIWMNKGPYTGRFIINSSYFDGEQWAPAERISIATDASPTTAWHPELAMDPQGNAVAVWTQLDVDSKWHIYANYYEAGIGWGGPAKIDNDSVGAAEPQVAMDAQGNTVIVWIGNSVWTTRSGPYPSFEGFDWGYYGNTVWSARLTPGQGWSQPQQIVSGQGVRVYGPHVTSNSKGNLAVMWYEFGPKDRIAGGENIHGVWVAMSKFGNTTWNTPELIGQGYQRLWGDYYRYRIGHDDCGNMIATWMKNGEVWANTYSTVVAGTVPIVDAPDNIVVEATDILTPVEIGTGTATDAIDGTIPATPDKSGPFPLGTTVVTWTATNSAGRTGRAVQTITVRDTTPPKLTVPQGISVTYSDPTKIPAAIDIGQAGATDIFTPVTIINNAPDTFDLGTTIVTWTATDANGNETKAEQTVTVSYNGELFVQITSPESYANVDNNTTLVEGDWLGPVNTGITVNGAVAETYGRHFYVNQLRLAQGDNTLTAVATTLNGQTATNTVTISSKGLTRPYDITLTPEGGVALLPVELTVTANTTIPIYKIWVDFDGDGLNDSATEDANKPIDYSYRQPGIYRVNVSVMDVDSNVYQESLVIVANNPNDMDKLFTDMWDGMNSALVSGNVGQAVMYLDSGAKFKYQPVFEALLPHMSDIVGSYSRMHRISINSDIGEYAITRSIENNQKVFFIYFLRGLDGVWRLDEI
ncbi:MAG: HYR domain-containing protein, partial [Gammaproteobacteria bacterium]|nr:HYR domain-containing protein [Gammaproteobacteria bacterium]